MSEIDRFHCVTQLGEDSWEYRLKRPGEAPNVDDLVHADTLEAREQVIAACHHAIGESEHSDHDTLAEGITLRLTEARERLALEESALSTPQAEIARLRSALGELVTIYGPSTEYDFKARAAWVRAEFALASAPTETSGCRK